MRLKSFIKTSTYNSLLIILFTCCHHFINAQAPNIEWQNTIGGNNQDYLMSVAISDDGGFLLGGSSYSNISGDKTENSNGSSDCWVIKLDPAGNIFWQKTIGGNNGDEINSISPTADGGCVLGCSSDSDISGDKTENSMGGLDFWVVKLDAFSNISWQTTIGGSEGDYLRSIDQTTDGGYILGGISYSDISGDKTEDSNGLLDYWVIKLDAMGNITWQNTIGGSGDDELTSIIETSDGGYIITGNSNSPISGDKTEGADGYSDYWVVKIDASGNISWQNTIGGSSTDELSSVVQTTDGGYILGGHSSSDISEDKTENSMGGMDYWVIKLDALGNISWQNTIGGSSGDLLFSIDQTIDGGCVLGGLSISNISGDKTEDSYGNTDFWIVKLNAQGSITWQKTIGGSSSDAFESMAKTLDGGYILGGSSSSNISGNKTENSVGGSDYWVVKLEAVYGCMDPESCNFNSSVSVDDGSCNTCFNLADLNIDGLINVSDLLAFLTDFNCSSGQCSADFNGDGETNTADLLILLSMFG